jgi:hypothetical protein
VKQPQFTQKLFKFEYFFKAQLYCHSLFAVIFVTVMVALLALETLGEATPIETNSIYVALSVTQGSQGEVLWAFSQKNFANLNTVPRLMNIGIFFSEIFVTMTVALLALDTMSEATQIETDST